MAIINKTRYK